MKRSVGDPLFDFVHPLFDLSDAAVDVVPLRKAGLESRTRVRRQCLERVPPAMNGVQLVADLVTSGSGRVRHRLLGPNVGG